MFTDALSAAERCAAEDREPASDVSASSPGYRIVEHAPDSPRRAEAEEFVRHQFQRTHGARIETFMPTLLTLTDAAGALRGVTGCRFADGGALFLERYLDRPIEEMLAASTGARVKRCEVVEIGNFACRDSRMACVFMSLLPRYLIEKRQVWIAFTATVSIRRILRLLGARCVEFGAADGACVRDGADKWGRYYSSDPRVMGGYLPLARRTPALWRPPHAD